MHAMFRQAGQFMKNFALNLDLSGWKDKLTNVNSMQAMFTRALCMPI